MLEHRAQILGPALTKSHVHTGPRPAHPTFCTQLRCIVSPLNYQISQYHSYIFFINGWENQYQKAWEVSELTSRSKKHENLSKNKGSRYEQLKTYRAW